MNPKYKKSPKIQTLKFKSTGGIGPSLRNPIAYDSYYTGIAKLINSDQSQLSIRPQVSRNLEILAFNLNNPALSEADIRRAIYLSIDRKALLKELYKTSGKVSYDLDYDSKIYIDNDIEKRIGKKLIANSNYIKYKKPNSTIFLRLHHEDTIFRKKS